MRRQFWMTVCAVAAAACAVGQQTSTVPGAAETQQSPAPAPPATPQPAAAPPPSASASDEIDGGGSIGFFYWYGPSHPSMKTGKGAARGANPSDWTYPGNSKAMPGVVLSLPAGRSNALRFYYFRIQGNGAGTTPQDISLYGSEYPSGSYISSSYTLQNVKLQWDYLTWPFPAREASFRIKTLWEVQYTTMKSTFDAPFIRDAAGDFTPTFSSKSSSLLYPTFGVGLEKRFSRAVRWEGRASGFAFPHRATIWDADTFLAFKGGQLELLVGGKAFHFRTSPQKSEYIYGTWTGGYAGIRWYPHF